MLWNQTTCGKGRVRSIFEGVFARLSLGYSGRLGVAAIIGLFVASVALPREAQSQGKRRSVGDAALANAVEHYQKKRYREAALSFFRLASGAAGGQQAVVQESQFFLGKSLYQLEYYQSALSVFDEISEDKSHPFFEPTLSWLGRLASQLPPPAGIIEKVGRYGEGQLRQFDKKGTEDLYNHLLFLMGQYRYTEGEFQQANRLFRRIDKDSEWYIKAKFFEGISHVRMRRAKPAVASFREILRAIEKGKTGDLSGDEKKRMRDLAWLSLARVYYSASIQDDASGRRSVDGRVLGNAIEAWNKIEPGSEYWLDALFEESWAFFLADEYSRALGNVHTLHSPYFEDYYYPEAHVLKAVTFFANCQMSNASVMVSRFHEKYDPVKSDLERVIRKYNDNTSFFEFLRKVQNDEANLPPSIRGIVKSALSDRTLLRHLEYHRLLEEEEERLSKAPSEFRSSPVGERVLEDIAIAKSFAVDQAGNSARGRYRRLIDELQNLMNQIDSVELEIATYRRGQLSQELQQQQLEAARRGGGQVQVDEEHQVWPFDGEYWRDELGFYRQEVTFKCGR